MQLSDYDICRFNSNVLKLTDEDCWEFKGGIQKLGYGTVTIRNKHKVTYYAHRVAYFLANGEFDESKNVLHRCDNRSCCNPGHLFLGTHQDNMADKVAKGRQSSLVGSDHPQARLTEEQVIEIYKLKDKVTPTGLAKHYNIDRTHIHNIWKNKSWTHITAKIIVNPISISAYLKERLSKLRGTLNFE